MIDRVLPSMSATMTITAATGGFIATSLRLCCNLRRVCRYDPRSSGLVQSPSAGRKHASDQNTQRDVIERMTENVHGVVPAWIL